MTKIKLFTTLALFAVSLALPAQAAEKTYRARITYYHDKVPTASGVKPRTGVTVAAHPKFGFGSRIEIPGLKGKVGNGTFVVQDRGPAVTVRKASRGKEFVFDIYVSSRSDINRKANSLPMYMDVTILE